MPWPRSNVDSHSYSRHVKDAPFVFALLDLDDCGLEPLERVVEGIDLVVNLERLLPLPGVEGLALKRGYLNGPAIENSVRITSLSGILEMERISVGLTDQCT